jgi:hypothetical protein
MKGGSDICVRRILSVSRLAVAIAIREIEVDVMKPLIWEQLKFPRFHFDAVIIIAAPTNDLDPAGATETDAARQLARLGVRVSLQLPGMRE